MRPLILDSIFRSLRTLDGVGPKSATLFEKLLRGEKIIDLLRHKPVDCIHRGDVKPLSEINKEGIATTQVTITSHSPAKRRGAPYRISATDDGQPMDIVYFNAPGQWLKDTYPIDKDIIISGKIEFYNDKIQMLHPDYAVPPEKKNEIKAFEPIYPMTGGLSPKLLHKAIIGGIKHLPTLPEWMDPSMIKKHEWDGWHDTMCALHNPQSSKETLSDSVIRTRLAYDEALARQLAMQLVRLTFKKKKGIPFTNAPDLRQKLLDALPFELTGAQSRSLSEIDDDMASPTRMLRLLQGDVGSGKTVVALGTMLNCINDGFQSAMMAPTEILARQHAQTLQPLCDAIGVTMITLTGRDKGKDRAAILEKIENGDAQIIIGTHAIFQDTVNFKNLGCVVIDEQHRFGVHQRLSLSDKGVAPDVLVMTATPIPRTLTLSLFGDMDVSRLDEKPAGRKPIETVLISNDRMGDIAQGLKRKIETGERIYWVCPLVEESEKMQALANAEDRHTLLQQIYGDRVGLVHGRMKPLEKDMVMKKFAGGELDILVATTVIEVGVNVPEATVMIIEHAERFGLAQLHQLRGRVGRGSDKSSCILMYNAPLSEAGKERLSIMKKSEDGFIIAEKDLELRGAGEVLGTKQSGLPAMHFVDLDSHRDLMQMAHQDARLITEKDPTLSTRRGDALKTLLYLFEQDEAVKTLGSG
jgi:ATP-dependent DNA helicase RecG